MIVGSKGGKLNGEEEGVDFRCDWGVVFWMVSVNGKKLDGDVYMDLDSYDGSSIVKLDVEVE